MKREEEIKREGRGKEEEKEEYMKREDEIKREERGEE